MENNQQIYYHVKVTLYDKPALYEAIRECFTNSLTLPCEDLFFPVLISTRNPNISNDNFILTRQQIQQLHLDESRPMYINCPLSQIMLYAHNSITLEMLKKILHGEI